MPYNQDKNNAMKRVVYGLDALRMRGRLLSGSDGLGPGVSGGTAWASSR
ncbi:MAG: hypothetical protein R3F37_16675 [Candidatus Competibacteraceae bacterium]